MEQAFCAGDRVWVPTFTGLSVRQVALLFGISKSAAHRIVDHLAPLLDLAPTSRRHGPDTVLIVDGTLVPTHDRTITASSKNYRFSVNMQVVIDANTRLVTAVGRPVPGNHNDCTAYRDSEVEKAVGDAHVMADGGYQGNPRVIMPYRKPRNGGELLAWQVELNTVHKRVRARVEHAFAQMKWWNILRNCRRKHRRCPARHPRHRPHAQPHPGQLIQPPATDDIVTARHPLIITGQPLGSG